MSGDEKLGLYMEIDLGALKENVLEIKNSSKCDLIAVVKSDAYGVGAAKLITYLEKLNVKEFAVLDLEELRVLLEEKITSEILILNSSNDLRLLEHYPNLKPSINSLADAYLIKDIKHYQKVHMQIDTGMNRLGFTNINEYLLALHILRTNPFIDIEGIYTHFTDKGNQDRQTALFSSYLDYHPYRMIHLAASSTYDEPQPGNYVRVGVSLYTLKKQVIRIVCYPIKIMKIAKGTTLGYNQNYQAREDEVIAILPAGYDNGYLRRLQGFHVYANSKYYKVVGNICMNHLFVKIDESITLDTKFYLTSNEISIESIANKLETIPHEVLCSFKIKDKRYIE